jgi:Tol biopolymer transport system component
MDLASRQVIFTRQRASQPALTSDGTHLAYRSWDSSHLGLFEVMLTGQNERYLSVHEESQRPQWGPDNRAVAFSFLKTENDHEIKTIDFDDESFPLVPPDPGGFAQTAAWAPDGRLVFHACRMNACGLASALTNGAGFTFLTDSPDDISPAVSPDGQQIAYTSRQGDNWDVYRVGIKGGQPTRLTTQPGKDGIPTWSPDGAWIAYASEVDGRWAVWVMTPDGQDQQQLVPLPGSLEGKVEAFVDDVQRGWRMESISWVR